MAAAIGVFNDALNNIVFSGKLIAFTDHLYTEQFYKKQQADQYDKNPDIKPSVIHYIVLTLL